MATFKYYLKRMDAKTETTIFLSIYTKNVRAKFYLPMSVHPRDWDQEGQRVIKRPDRSEMNTNLFTVLTEAGRIANRLLSENKTEPSSHDIRKGLEAYFLSAPAPSLPKTVVSYFQHFIEKSASRTNPKTNKLISPGTLKTWKNNLKILSDFETYRRRQIQFEDVDFDFYTDFKEYLEKQRHYSLNTVGRCIKVLKIVLNDAAAEGVNTSTKYKSTKFRTVTEPANSIFLNELDLKEMQALDLSSNKRLEQVRDWFLIGCWTGLRFSDWKTLNAACINDDRTVISITAQKTQKSVAVPISPELNAVLRKYLSPEGQGFPKLISDQRFNDYLKEVAQMMECLKTTFSKLRTKAGMKISSQLEKWQLVTTHTARRSFATNMFKRGYPVPLIMTATGHKTESEFYKYIQMTPHDQADQLRQLMIETTSRSLLKIAE